MLGIALVQFDQYMICDCGLIDLCMGLIWDLSMDDHDVNHNLQFSIILPVPASTHPTVISKLHHL